jgi:hypothetical protein
VQQSQGPSRRNRRIIPEPHSLLLSLPSELPIDELNRKPEGKPVIDMADVIQPPGAQNSQKDEELI